MQRQHAPCLYRPPPLLSGPSANSRTSASSLQLITLHLGGGRPALARAAHGLPTADSCCGQATPPIPFPLHPCHSFVQTFANPRRRPAFFPCICALFFRIQSLTGGRTSSSPRPTPTSITPTPTYTQQQLDRAPTKHYGTGARQPSLNLKRIHMPPRAVRASASLSCGGSIPFCCLVALHIPRMSAALTRFISCKSLQLCKWWCSGVV